jgi:4-amino-4-deoxy-L-arabinose transferase-like glycosyltransferase
VTRRLAAVPTVVWYVSALWLALLLGASVLWPMSSGYDEVNHIGMALVYSSHPFHFYGPGQLHSTKVQIALNAMLPSFNHDLSVAGHAILPRGHRLSFQQLGGATIVADSYPNQMVQHPPLYYWIEAVLLRVPGVTTIAWDQTVWLMRLVSVACMAPIPLLCWATTRRMLAGWRGPWRRGQATAGIVRTDLTPRLALIGAALPLTIPNMVRDGSSVTNDSLLVLTTSVVLYGVSRVLTGDLTRRTAVMIAVFLAAALWTKGFALVLPPVVLVTYLIAWWRRPTSARRIAVLWPPLVIAAIGAAVGSLWWLRNLVKYGTVQIDGLGPKFQQLIYGPPDHAGTLTHFIPPFVTGFVMRIWGGVGIPDIPDPGPFIEYGWFFVVLIGVVAALAMRGSTGSRVRSAVLTSAAVLTALVVAEGSFQTFAKWSNALSGVQGRYIYSTVTAIASVATVGWLQLTRPRTHATFAPFVVIGAVVTNAAVWILILRSWYAPVGTASSEGFLGSVHALFRWSPLPSPVTLVFVFVLPALAALTTIIVVVRDSGTLRRLLVGDGRGSDADGQLVGASDSEGIRANR